MDFSWLEAPTPGPGDTDLRRLLIARHKAALAEIRIKAVSFEAGSAKASIVELYESIKRVHDSADEVFEDPAVRLKALEKLADLARVVEKGVTSKFDAGVAPPEVLERARYERLDAEIRVLRAKQAMKPKEP